MRLSAKRCVGVRAILLLAVCVAWGVGVGSAAAADPSENAALYYWKAAALDLVPLSPADIETLAFIDGDLTDLPPRVFAARPEALRWLLADRNMLIALDRGAAQSVCLFPLYAGINPAPDLAHLPALRTLARRALGAAKAYEYAGNPVGAGGIYANLLRMIQHLDQDRTLYSCAGAGELLQLVLSGLEGFVSRDQPAEAFDRLSLCFRDAPERILSPGAALRDEYARYAEWLLADSTNVVAKLDELYRDAKHKPAVEKLMALPEKTRMRTVEAWLDGCRKWNEEVATALEKPYAVGMAQIQKLDARRKRILDDPKGGENPLVPLMIPEATDVYLRILLAEAQFDMADILCLTGIFRAEAGEWPDTLGDVQPLGFRSLPLDSFSGESFHYRNVRGSPVLIARVPKRMASERYLFEINIRSRRAKDDDLGAKAIKILNEQRARETGAPVPMR